MPGCPYEAVGASDDEVLAQAAEHAKSAHGIEEFSPELMGQVRGAIQETN
jgi:predicted small metal-binding protein